MPKSEISLVFLKPEATMRPSVAARIISELLGEVHIQILSFQRLRVSEALARKHYAEHETKPFFPKLLMQVQSGPVIAMIFRGSGATGKIREIAGATFVEDAAADTLRGKYGIIKGLNIIHASDSPESGVREVALWKKEVPLQEDPGPALKDARDFVARWEGTGDNDTLAIRNLCSGPLDAGRRAKIVEILEKDARGTDVTKAEIDQIVGVIEATLME